MDIGTIQAIGACFAIEEAVRQHPQDGPIYEDHLVKVWREDGNVVMQGKPIKSPMIYGE